MFVSLMIAAFILIATSRGPSAQLPAPPRMTAGSAGWIPLSGAGARLAVDRLAVRLNASGPRLSPPPDATSLLVMSARTAAALLLPAPAAQIPPGLRPVTTVAGPHEPAGGVRPPRSYRTAATPAHRTAHADGPAMDRDQLARSLVASGIGALLIAGFGLILVGIRRRLW